MQISFLSTPSLPNLIFNSLSLTLALSLSLCLLVQNIPFFVSASTKVLRSFVDSDFVVVPCIIVVVFCFVIKIRKLNLNPYSLKSLVGLIPGYVFVKGSFIAASGVFNPLATMVPSGVKTSASQANGKFYGN